MPLLRPAPGGSCGAGPVAERCAAAAAAAAAVSPARPAAAVAISRPPASCDARSCVLAARPSSRRCLLPTMPLRPFPAATVAALEANGLCMARCAWAASTRLQCSSRIRMLECSVAVSIAVAAGAAAAPSPAVAAAAAASLAATAGTATLLAGCVAVAAAAACVLPLPATAMGANDAAPLPADCRDLAAPGGGLHSASSPTATAATSAWTASPQPFNRPCGCTKSSLWSGLTLHQCQMEQQRTLVYL